MLAVILSIKWASPHAHKHYSNPLMYLCQNIWDLPQMKRRGFDHPCRCNAISQNTSCAGSYVFPLLLRERPSPLLYACRTSLTVALPRSNKVKWPACSQHGHCKAYTVLPVLGPWGVQIIVYDECACSWAVAIVHDVLNMGISKNSFRFSCNFHRHIGFTNIKHKLSDCSTMAWTVPFQQATALLAGVEEKWGGWRGGCLELFPASPQAMGHISSFSLSHENASVHYIWEKFPYVFCMP